MHKARAIVYLFIAIANVAISIPLIKLMGPIGAALGTAISLIAGNIIFMNIYYQKRIGLDILALLNWDCLQWPIRLCMLSRCISLE